jgi:cytochrome c553
MLSRLNGLAWLASTALSLSWSLGAHAAGNPADGEKKFYTCYGCHGIDNYRNAYPDYSVPKLRHQNAAYIVAALQEYRSGARPHATMHAQAASLSDQDMEDIAAYLQGAEPVKPSAAAAGKAPKQVAACVACHGETGLGVEAPLTPKPAVLAGQHVDYLEQALDAYRNGRRQNAVMDSMAKLLLSEEDVKIAASYFANQSAALVTATTGSK